MATSSFWTTATSCRAGTGAPSLSLGPRPAGSQVPPSRPRPSGLARPRPRPRAPPPRAHLPFPLGPALPRCTPRPAGSQIPPSQAPPLKSSSAQAPPHQHSRLPGPRLVRSSAPPQGPTPLGPQSVLPPLMPGSCRAVGRPPGEPRPLPATCGWCCRMPSWAGPGAVTGFRWVPRWAGRASAAPALTVLPSQEGLCRLLELTRRPIFITFEASGALPHPALRLLRQHRHLRDPAALEARLSVVRRGGAHGVLCMGPRRRLPWSAAQRSGLLGAEEARVFMCWHRPPSPIHVVRTLTAPPCLQETPSSDFWKELRLALPRKCSTDRWRETPRPGCRTTRTPC